MWIRGYGTLIDPPLYGGKGENCPFPNAPIEITRTWWYVAFLFSKILAYCWTWCYYYCIICFALWKIPKKNELHTYCSYPKKKELEYITNFRPISLGNVVSQIISKILANRIKPILPNIIFDSQSAFMPNRIITNNTTMAFEMIHHMRNRRNGKKSHLVVKLDISIAYDMVEFEFLQRIMLKLAYRSNGSTSPWKLCALHSIQL